MNIDEHLNKFYNSTNENERLQSRRGQVEYLTTMRYLNNYLEKNMKVLDIGAGTGRYSIALAAQGYHVDAIWLGSSKTGLDSIMGNI